ncbi:MAG: hypothetical protein MUD01_23705 [Chloroflexaceae bacterium]|nr:hypothetical protein [Chloroflexaceae bacterium]
MIDDFWYKVIFVVVVTIAQGFLWAWVGISIKRVIPGFTWKGYSQEVWAGAKERAAAVLAMVDNTLKTGRR